MKVVSLLLLTLLTQNVMANEVKKPKYKSGKRIDFKALLIEGEKKKADFSVVTGNIGEQDFCDSKQCTLKANCNIVSPIRDLQVMTNDFFKKININELLNGNLI